MALIARGVTRCAHCEHVLSEGDEVEAFTTFVFNEADPLFRFNDVAFHKRCLEVDPLGTQAQARADEAHRRLGPGSHRCAVCQKEIESWRDNLSFPYLTDQPDNLASLNYLQFHRQCLQTWPGLARARASLRHGIDIGRLRGSVFTNLEAELAAAAPR